MWARWSGAVPDLTESRNRYSFVSALCWIAHQDGGVAILEVVVRDRREPPTVQVDAARYVVEAVPLNLPPSNLIVEILRSSDAMQATRASQSSSYGRTVRELP